ncbi:ABC transporter permease (plasmid) [Mesorhizobium sp. ORM8.1]
MPAAILMVLMLAITFWVQPNAMSSFGVQLLLEASVPIAFAALAQMMFLLGGDIDLGTGYAVGLVNVIAATTLVDHTALGAVALLGFIASYALMAAIVELMRVSSVVVTMGSSFLWLGLSLALLDRPGGSTPDWLTWVTATNVGVIPLPVYFLVAAALIGVWILRGFKSSIKLRAFGGSPKIYRELGYSPLKARATLYSIAATLIVVAGLLITASTGAGNANVATTYTLASVAAVVVGGATSAADASRPWARSWRLSVCRW